MSDARLGLVFAIISSIGLGLAIAVGRLAFEGGTDGLTIAMTRCWFGAVLVAIYLKARGTSLFMPKAFRIHAVILGLLMVQMTWGNVTSVAYIPVGLAALLFFVYPPLVAVFVAVLDRRPPGLVKVLAVGTAFAGLAVMLGVRFESLDWRGVALGLGAGIACAMNVVWVSRKNTGIVDPMVVVFWMSIVAGTALTVGVILNGGWTVPKTTGGWIGLWGVVLLQGASIPLYFAAIARGGPEHIAVLNNLQPVASIAAAWVLFSEVLTIERVLGAAMVLGGILLMQLQDRTRQPQTEQKATRD